MTGPRNNWSISRAAKRTAGTKRFCHEWIFETFADHPTFFTKPMFGGLAAYLFERQMMLLVEPTKTGRWKWHGALVCTSAEHHGSIQKQFPAVQPHPVLKKWLYIDSSHADFETTMSGVAGSMAKGDLRFGIVPRRRP